MLTWTAILIENNSKFESVIDEFTAEWMAGEAPDIRAYADRFDDERLLLELVLAEMELKIQNGLVARVEQYLDRFSDADWNEFQIERLIQHEFELRSDTGEQLQIGEFAERFPTAYECLGSPDWQMTRGVGFDSEDASTDRNIFVAPAGDRYELEQVHAQGGLGTVWVARDRVLNRRVAIKEVKAKFSSASQLNQRLIVEAAISGKLEHPGIVPVHDLGKFENGQPFYVMRFVEGRTMAEAIEEFHQSPDDSNLELMRLLRQLVDVCNTIHFAHSKNVIHRDIKPHNIMLGSYGETLVVDWGLAKDLSVASKATNRRSKPPQGFDTSTGAESATRLGDVIGTHGFMSPEQAQGKLGELSIRSDVYSLGASLQFLLTGQQPKPSIEIESLAPNLRPLVSIAKKAMDSDPQQRYSSAKSIADELERFMADELVEAHQETVSERLNRLGRLHSRLIAWTAGAMLAISILATVAAFAINAQRAKATSSAELASRQKDKLSKTLQSFGKVFLPWANADDRTRSGLLSEVLERAYEEAEAQEASDEYVAARIYNFAAHLYLRNGQRAQASRCAKKMAQLYKPNAEEVRELLFAKYFYASTTSDNQIAITQLDEVLQNQASTNIPALRQKAFNLKAKIYMKEKEFENALATIDRAIATSAQNPSPTFNLQLALRKSTIVNELGRTEEAEKLKQDAKTNFIAATENLLTEEETLQKFQDTLAEQVELAK